MATEARARLMAARREGRAAVWCAAGAAAVAATTAGWWHWLNAVPDVTIPAPAAMPSPNGFDDLLRAAKEEVDQESVDLATRRPDVLEEESLKRKVPKTPADRAKLVAENEKALADARLALSRDFGCPVQRDFTKPGAFSSYLARFRQVARLLNLEGVSREDRQDWSGALASRLDCAELGADKVGRNGPVINWLVGAACEAIGRRPLWALVDKVGAADARAAALRLERIDAGRYTAADAFTEEKWGGMTSLQSQFRAGTTFHVLREYYKPMSPDDDSASRFPLSTYLPLLWTSKTAVMSHYTTMMDRSIAASRDGARSKTPSELPREYADPITQILYPIWNTVWMKEADARMQTRLLAAMYAVRAFQIEHGASPSSLDALVSLGYLKAVPVDPFDPAGGPLRYRPILGNKYLLYSVGPDGKDDGGKAIDPTDGGRSSRKSWAEAGMVGDWVVDVDSYVAAPAAAAAKAP